MIDKEPTIILNQSEYTVTHGDKIIDKGIIAKHYPFASTAQAV